MKLRFLACLAVALMVVGASALWSTRARAQDGQSGQGRQSGQDRKPSPDIEKALRAYQERMDRDLQKCREELGEMKKELHELIDMRLDMAISLAEYRARHGMTGMAFGGPGGPQAAFRPAQAPGSSRGQGEGHASPTGLGREFRQIHEQLRSEIEQQRNQVEQFAAQLRAVNEQEHQGQPGQGQDQNARGQGQRGQGESPDKQQGQQKQGGRQEEKKAG